MRGWPPKSLVYNSSAGMIWDHITALEPLFQLIVIVVIIIVIVVVVIIVNQIQDVSTFQLAFTVRLPEGSLEIEVDYSTKWCLTVTSWCIKDITLYHPHQTRDFPLHSPSTSHQFPPMSTLSDKARQHVRWRLSPGSSSQKDGIGCTFSHLTCKWAGNTTWSIPTMHPSFSCPPSPPPKKWFGASVQCETGAKV